MKKSDILLVIIAASLLTSFIFFPTLLGQYNYLNTTYGMWMSFLKFAILATLGECIALRIQTGNYNQKGFGIIPRAIVWGFLGLTIKMAFVIFATGTPVFMEYLGVNGAATTMKSGLSGLKIFTAFSISLAMNLIYAPVLMTLHKITDIHIVSNGGTIYGLFRPIKVRSIFNSIDWDRMWNFVFKKTIPFFWIPAHTITFLLPEAWQVLFAALLGVALGVILSITPNKK